MTNYKDSGVDIEAGNDLVSRIRGKVARTHNHLVLPNFGDFAAMMELPPGYKRPVLVSCTDGVGTKVKLADEYGFNHTIGQDLVAMCVNDLICCGASPLFFLDYFATSALKVGQAEEIITGIAEACKVAGCSLVGGETAEMPGVYNDGDYDLAGFAVGVVEHDDIIDGSTIAAGDVLVGLKSSGIHSNGYSLVRMLMDEHPGLMTHNKEAICAPTKLYTDVIQKINKATNVKGIAHITGGGIYENLPRMFKQSKGVKARVDVHNWEWPRVFKDIMLLSETSNQDMMTTFNCGIGMILCVSSTDADIIINSSNGDAVLIGEVLPK